MAGSETGPSRGGLTAGHTSISADCADYAGEARRMTDTSPGRGLRISSRFAATLLACASLAAATAPPAAAQEALQQADASDFSPGAIPSLLTNANPEPARRAEPAPAARGNTLERNPPATGHLRVGGYGTRSWTDSLRVNATLNVYTDSIRDADGLEHVEWRYQWIRVTTGGSETNIAEATRPWYYVSESDLGHRLKVRVTFQDDEGNWERVESELSAVVDVMTTDEHALISLEADKDTVEVGQWVNFTIRRRGEMQQQIRGDINVQGIEPAIYDWNLYAYVFRGQATRNWNLQVEAEPGGVHTPGRTITALLRGVFKDFALVDTTAVKVIVVPAGTLSRGDVGSPDVENATVDGSILVIRYDETLGSSSNPSESAYNVSINNGAGTNPTAVEVAGRTVTLTLGTPAAHGDDVTVSYTAPPNGAIQDESQNEAINLTNYPVTNNTAAPPRRGLLASPNPVTVPEGGTAQYTLVLESQPTATVTVTATHSGDSDISVTGGATLTFTTQNWFRPQTVTLSAATDTDTDDGTATITHMSSGGDYGANNIGTTVTATEDDSGGNSGNVISTGITLSLDPAQVGESDGQKTVKVTGRLNGETMQSSKTVSVTLGGAGDGATPGTDYATSGGFTFEIPGGATEGSGTFTITPTPDDLVEGKETVTVAGSVSGLSVSSAIVTIIDDDRRGLFPSPRAATVPEGETAEYTLVLESEPTATVTVTASHSGDSDISVTGGATLTFTTQDWFRPQTVTLSAATDADTDDGTATITHTASGADYGSITATVTATEQDSGGDGDGDDGRGGTPSTAVRLTLSPADVGEADGETTVTVTGWLDGDALESTTTVSVMVGAIGDGAEPDTDYGRVADFTFTIAAGATSGSGAFSFTPEDDDYAEGDESVTVFGSAAELTVEGATLTIVDDNRAAILPNPRTVTVPEGETATYTLVLESEPTATVTVTAERVGDEDITVTGGATLTFTPDDWYVPQMVTLGAAVDADYLDGTATITHTAAGGEYGENNVSATVTAIEEDRMATSAKVTLSLSPDEVDEADGEATVTVTGQLDGTARESITTVSVMVGAAGDGAEAGTDYGRVADFTFEIAAGTTSGSGTFTITPTDDDIDEGDESVTVSGSATGLAVEGATLTIVDDDSRGIFPNPRTVIVPEGETATYTLVLESEPTATVTVTASRTGDEDITLTAGDRLTFTADDWYVPQTVTLSAAVDADTLDGTATITHTAAGGDYGGVSATVTAIEEDGLGASAKVTLSLSPADVDEADGEATVTVTGQLDGTARESITTVSVMVGAAGDGAEAGTDYGRVADFTFEIAAGTTSGSGTFTITPTDDDIDEGDESVTVSGSATGLAVEGATLTIVDDDSRGIFPNPRTVIVPEGETATYTLVLESEPTATVTVTASRTGDEDITLTAGDRLTFTADDWYVPQTVTLSAAVDADTLDGTATITHTAAGGDYGGVSATVTAIEEDGLGASAKVTLSLSPADVDEADGEATVTVTGQLDGTARESITTVSVMVGAAGDGAEAGTDYGRVADFTFEIAAGTTSGSGTFTITPTDDDIDEGDESVTVSGSATGLAVEGATLTIVDDDSRGIFPNPRTVIVPEGETATYTLVLESEPTASITVTTTHAGDEDITATGGDTLTFTADDWYVPQTVTLSAAHDDDDDDGTATLTHTASGGDYDRVTATVTAVEKDDEDAWTLEFRADGAPLNSVAEDAGSVEVVLTRGQAPSEPIEVTLSGDGSAERGSDWELENTTLTLAAGATETTAQMTILDDARLEDSESVTVRASVAGSEVASGALEILDEDRATIALVTETPTVEEGGSVKVSVVVEPTGVGCVIPFDIMPAISVEDSGGAVSGSVPTTVMIPACEPAATFSFDTDDDDEATGDRLVVLTTAVSEDERISGGTLTVRVIDNDNSPAEGAPTITGIPQVEETLTAHTDGISDADGLTEVAWRYQWLLVSGGSETEIAGAAERTYLIREDDVGSRLKVRVDFEDDAGNAESLTSVPTDEVRPAPVTPVVTVAPDMTTVREGQLALFTVSAVPAPDEALTVNVRVSGTKDVVAGVPVSSVTIGVGQDSALVAVATEDDDVDEGAVAGVVTTGVLAGPGYEVGTPASGDIVVLDNDEAPITDLTGWLARVGRTASDQVLETVRGRMTRGPGGSRLIIGDWDAGGLESHYSVKPSERLATWAADPQSRTGWPNQSVYDLVSRSSFNASGRLATGGGYWSAWGRGARTRFSGGEGAGAVDGEMNGFMAGFDLGRGRWMGGIVISHNRADGTLGGSSLRTRDVRTILTGAYPWARYLVSDRFSVWGMLGYAGGTLSLDGASSSDPGASLAMAAFGWRGDVIGSSGADGFALAVTSDAMLSRASTPGDATLGEQSGGVSRARLLVEGSHNFQLGEATLEPLAEVGVRHDQGDAETGAGMEMGGGLSVTVPSLGLTLQGRARGLVAHEDDTYEEWGGSAVIHIQPDASGQGLSLRISPAWGHTEGSAGRLFERRDMRGIASRTGAGPYRSGITDAEIGYGVPLAGDLIAIPYGGVAGEARRVGVGLRAVSLFDLRFEGYDGYGQRAVRLFAGLETHGFMLSLEGASGGASGSEATLRVRRRSREQQ